jgi:alkylation response protein AidB-like acyl-CoA dehydrogenase
MTAEEIDAASHEGPTGWLDADGAGETALVWRAGPNAIDFTLTCRQSDKMLVASAESTGTTAAPLADATPATLFIGAALFRSTVSPDAGQLTMSLTLPVTKDLLAAFASAESARIVVGDSFTQAGPKRGEQTQGLRREPRQTHRRQALSPNERRTFNKIGGIRLMFTLTEEHVLLRDAARGFVQDKLPTTHLRNLRDAGNPDGFDRAAWAEMAAMGWTGILVPEEHGGAALGPIGLGLILQEAGRTLAPSPLLSTAMIGASALTLGGTTAQQAGFLPRIADGSLIIALAVDETAHHAPDRIATTATASNGGYALSGRKTFVADGHVADTLLVTARTSDGPGVFIVPADAPGLTRTRLHTVDSRGAADIQFSDVALGADARLQGGGDLIDAVLDRARIGLAAEMLGQAQQAFEVIADYLKTRTQFGQLIGSFQALQHRAGKMLVELEMTQSCVAAALDALESGRNDVAEYASLAKARAAETLHLITNEMVQIHGGIGMTDAHDSGLYIKRARVAEALYGSAAFHRDRYATLNGF